MYTIYQDMELTVIQAVERGITAHKSGNLQEAERIYKAILQSQPNHPDANHNLGVRRLHAAHLKKAVELTKVEQFWNTK